MADRSDGPLRAVLAAVLAALITGGLMTALNSSIAGQARAAPINPVAMLHDCMTFAIAANQTLPVSSTDWQLVAAYDDRSGPRVLVASAAGRVVECDWASPGRMGAVSLDTPSECPGPAPRPHDGDPVACPVTGWGSVIVGQISRQVAGLRVTFADGRTALATLAGGCFAVVDPDGTAVDDYIHMARIRIHATDATGSVLYDGPL